MAQEAQIKVNIDDNEALQALREMSALVAQISEGLGGLSVPPGAIPSAAPPPSAAPSPEGAPEEEERRASLKRVLKAEAQATIDTLTSPMSMSHVTQRFSSMLKNVAKTLPLGMGAPLALAGAAFQGLSASLQARQARLGEVMGLEAQEAEISGMIDTPSAQAFAQDRAKALESLGLDPMTARQLITGTASAVGFQATEQDFSSFRLSQLAAAERSGVSAGSIASLAGLIAQSTGDSVGQALDQSLSLRNLAESQMDLRGAGVEQFLSAIGGIVDNLTSQGITAQPTSIAQTLGGIARATGTRGQRPAQIFQGLQSLGRGAFSEISAPFQQLGQMAVLADIYSRSGDIFSAQQEAERLQADPSNIPQILARGLGGQAGQAALASIQGISAFDATRLIEGIDLGADVRMRQSPAQVAQSLQLSAAQAAQTGQTLRGLRDPQSTAIFQKMIEIGGASERNVLKMSENIDAIIKLTDIALGIQSALTGSVNLFSTALNTLQRMIP
jgi:hypothetical protein